MQGLKLACAVVGLTVLSMSGAALAQDTKAESNDNVKVLLENEQVRVMEMRFKPGAKLESLSHRNRFVYALTDGALVFTPPGRTAYELSFKAGEALWLPAQTAGTENDTDKEVRALVVDLKEIPRGKHRPKAGKPKGKAVSGAKPNPSAKKPRKSADKSGS
jgi:quercetin dioxygenase-like cupin family protein